MEEFTTLLNHGWQSWGYHGNIFCWNKSVQGTLSPKITPLPGTIVNLLCAFHNHPGRPGVWFWGQADDTVCRVLARPKRQGGAPCRFPTAPCCFFSALSFSESPLVSLGFHQRYFELEVAESVQLRRKVARFLCIRCYSRRTSPPSWIYDEY